MSKNHDNEVKVHRVQGTAASHLIVVKQKQVYADADESVKAYLAEASNLEAWDPENGASFDTVGKAVGWTKKLLAKNGWPKSEVFVVAPVQYQHKDRTIIAIPVYRLKDREVPEYARPHIADSTKVSISLDLLREIRAEITRLNQAAGETRFNPALTSGIDEILFL